MPDAGGEREGGLVLARGPGQTQPVLGFQALAGEISPFLCSGSHQVQRDCQPSALNCFVEAMSQCVPPIPIRPCVLKYLGKTHNLWFRSTLMLEHQAFEKGLSLQIKPKQTAEFYEQESITPPQQVRPRLRRSQVLMNASPVAADEGP